MLKTHLHALFFLFALAPLTSIIAMELPAKKSRLETSEDKTAEHKAEAASTQTPNNFEIVDFSLPFSTITELSDRLRMEFKKVAYHKDYGNLAFPCALFFDNRFIGKVHFVLQKVATGFFVRMAAFGEHLDISGSVTITCQGPITLRCLIYYCSRLLFGAFLDNLTVVRTKALLTNEVCPICQYPIASKDSEAEPVVNAHERCYLSCLHVLHTSCFRELHQHPIVGQRCPICRAAIDPENGFFLATKSANRDF